MLDAIDLAKRAFAEKGVDIYAPTLPYSKWSDRTGADGIVKVIARDLDRLWETRGKYERVVFVGHSMGGVLLRRVFLYGARRSPDFDGEFAHRDDLGGGLRPWAEKVERLVLIGTWDKGWSVSERDSWWAAIGLNLLGAWSRFMELFSKEESIGRSMFDMRRGSVFIVQTRLIWMAYRRWFDDNSIDQYNKIHAALGRRLDPPPEGTNNPLLVQLIGTVDDFVSPLDQVDNDVDCQDGFPTEQKNFFLLEMPDTGHKDAVKYKQTGDVLRRKAFITALIGDRTKPTALVDDSGKAEAIPPLAQVAKNPLFFEDKPVIADPEVRDLVFVIHGIRDDGYWTHRIAKAIKEVDDARRAGAPETAKSPPLVTCTPTYGYFPMGAFLLPWIRHQKTEWFMDLYVNVKAKYPNARLHYVGHSNGTFLAANALTKYKAARFANIYFAGSVVHPKFEWIDKLQKGAVERFHNVRGATDWVVALLPKSIDYITVPHPDLGGGGFDGFEETNFPANDPKLTQSERYALGGHSGAILEGHWQGIANFIVNGRKPSEPHELFVREPYRFLKAFSELRVGIPAGLLLGLILVLSPASIALAFQCLTEFGVAILTTPFAILLMPFEWLARTFPPSWHWLSYVIAAFTVIFVFGVLGKFNALLRPRLKRWFPVEVTPRQILVGGICATFVMLLPLIAHEANLIWDGSKSFAAGSALSLAGTVAFVAFVLTRF
jgi:pimeloyl-ACP methyl ester carboxylesterase